jgi:hypothetical protein
VFPVRPEWRDRLGAVTHVDGTARVQTLEREFAPRLYALIEAFRDRHRESRSCSTPRSTSRASRSCAPPQEGYSTFRRCGIDVLIAGNTRVRKRGQDTAPIAEIEGGGMIKKKRSGCGGSCWCWAALSGSTGEFARGCGARFNKKLIMPLALFLCLTGFLLILAAGRSAGTVHYSIF